MASPQTFYSDDRFRIAFWNNVSIIDVWGDLDAPRMQKIGESHRELLKRCPNGIVSIGLIQSSTPASSAASRAESAKFLKELGDQMRHTAMVIEAEGVIGLMLRAVVRGLNLLLKSNRLSLHERSEQAIRVIVPHVDVREEGSPGNVARDLAAAIADVRAQHVQLPRASGDA